MDHRGSSPGFADAAAGQDRKHGSSFGLRKYDEMIEWFEDNWPVGATWPNGVAHDRRLKAKKVFEVRTRSANGKSKAKKQKGSRKAA
jgi:hypothetical protein